MVKRWAFLFFLFSLTLFVISLMYKESKKKILLKFPVKFEKEENKWPIILYIFFSERNCRDNLEIIDTLNSLMKEVKIIGIVPSEEAKNEKRLRSRTHAKFEIIPISRKYYKFLPNYLPTIYGIGRGGEIYFVIPGVPGENKYFAEFLKSFLYKAYPLLESNEKDEEFP